MPYTISENDILRQTAGYDAIYDAIGAICPQDVLWHYLTAKRMGYDLECDNSTIYYISASDKNLLDDDLWETAQSDRYIDVRESVAEHTHAWQQKFSDAFLNYLHTHNAASYADNPQSADNNCSSPLECPWTYETNLDLWFDDDPHDAGKHYARHMLREGQIPLDKIVTYRSIRLITEIVLDTENDRVKIDGVWHTIAWEWKNAELENDSINGRVVWRQAGSITINDDAIDIDFIWHHDRDAETPEDCVLDWTHPERIDLDNVRYYRSDII